MGTIYKIGSTRHYQMQWVDETGKRRRQTTGTSDKATAQQILAKTEKEAAQIRAGLRDPITDAIVAHSREPAQAWVDAYVASLEVTHGTSNQHVADTRAKIEKIIASTSIDSAAKLNQQHVVDYIANRQKEDVSARTVQSYLVAIKGFTHWCVANNRLHRDPLVNLASPSPARDRRYQRRALSRAEWCRLKVTTENSPPRRHLSGPERALLYELALVTGLRAKELLSLKRSSFVFSGTSRYVMLPSSNTKNAKPAEQNLTRSLAVRLEEYLANKMPSAKAFPIVDLNRLAIVLKKDLEASRADWIKEVKSVDEINKRVASDFLLQVSHDGKRLDFHALRYTCGAWLAEANIHAKQIQKLMRHSTIRLTLDTYGHLFPEQMTEAIEALERALAV
jgi:integrase